MTKLKLAYVGGIKVPRPRPCLTDYAPGLMDGREAHSRTVGQAIDAAVRQVRKRNYSSAAVYNEAGQLVATVKRVRSGIMIHSQKRGTV